MRNQGVVITNLVFMILALILGAVTYFLFNNVSEKKQEIAALNAGTGAIKSEVSNMTSDFTELKKKLGYEDVAEAKQLDDTMRSDVEKALGLAETNSTYRDVVVTLGKNLNQKKAELAGGFQAQLDESARVSTSEQAKTDSQKTKFAEQEATIANDHSAAVAAAADTRNNLQKSFNAQAAELNDLVASTRADIQAANQDTADFKESKERFAAINDELSKRVDELSNASYERADAEIVFADQVRKIVRLNIGERDGVRPLTTFNVFEPTTLDMNDAVPKGSVQVVRSIGEHLCEAKILEDQMSNPVQQGDLVYTPLWRPGEVIRYALDFHLDIDGDGRSDLAKLMMLIRSSGAEVATYIDDEGVIQHEDKIAPDVYRVIVSEKSVADVLARAYSLDEATKERIAQDEQKFLRKFRDLNVETIYLQDFLKKIGYKETALVTEYDDELRERSGKDGVVDLLESGVGRQVVSPGIVAPIYTDGEKAPTSTGKTSPMFGGSKGAPPVSPGIVAPTYDKEAEKAPKSLGVNSDFYERNRPDKQD